MRKRKLKPPSDEVLALINELYQEGCEIHRCINRDGAWCWRIEGFIDYQDWESFEARSLPVAARQFRRFQQKVLKDAEARA